MCGKGGGCGGIARPESCLQAAAAVVAVPCTAARGHRARRRCSHTHLRTIVPQVEAVQRLVVG